MPELAGSFASELWSTFILRTAYHEPAIRHAVIALGSLHENFELAGDAHAADSQFGLQQYGKAIQCVVESPVPFARQSTDVALISCILFTAFESLQGHYKSALTHINSGLKVLAEREAEGEVQFESYVPRDLLKSLFIRFDTQVLEIGDLVARTPGKRGGQATQIPIMFSTLEEAQRVFDEYLNGLDHVLQSAENTWKANPRIMMQRHAKLVQDYQDWCGAFDDYLVRHLMDFSPATSILQPQPHPGILILQIWRIVVKIMLNIDLHHGEAAFDNFIEDSRMLVDLAESFINQTAIPKISTQAPSGVTLTRPKSVYRPGSNGSEGLELLRKKVSAQKGSPSHGFFGIQPDATPCIPAESAASPALSNSSSSTDSRSTGTLAGYSHPPVSGVSPRATPKPIAPRPMLGLKPTFSLSLGLITPLYMTVVRCRDPTIRRRALHLLHTCNRKEGIWDSRLAARVAERIVDLEEAGAVPLGGGPPSAEGDKIIVMSAEQIPECARVREMEVFFMPDRKGKIRYRKSMGNMETEASANLLEHYEAIIEW